MKYRGIEYSLKAVAEGVWRYNFVIGRAVKSGRLKVETEALAVARVQRRIDRQFRRLSD
jgi:hypothetical protein